MIKDDFLENVINVFQQHDWFEYVDFKINIHEDTLDITYLIEPRFHITFKDKNHFKDKKKSIKYDILGEAVPGKFSLHEPFSLTQKSDVYLKIENWLDDIWREISFNSPLSILEEEQQQIDEFCKKFDSAEGYFTTEEVIKIRAELAILKTELTKEIKTIIEDKHAQELELEKLNYHFETLENIAPHLKKKGWIRNLTGRIFHNVRKLLEIRQQDVLKKSSY